MSAPKIVQIAVVRYEADPPDVDAGGEYLYALDNKGGLWLLAVEDDEVPGEDDAFRWQRLPPLPADDPAEGV